MRLSFFCYMKLLVFLIHLKSVSGYFLVFYFVILQVVSEIFQFFYSESFFSHLFHIFGTEICVIFSVI